MDLQALWSTALEACEAMRGPGVSVELLRLASAGHPNAAALVERELVDVTGCTCGEDEPCDGVDTPERVRLRVALAALREAMGAAARGP